VDKTCSARPNPDERSGDKSDKPARLTIRQRNRAVSMVVDQLVSSHQRRLKKSWWCR